MKRSIQDPPVILAHAKAMMARQLPLFAACLSGCTRQDGATFLTPRGHEIHMGYQVCPGFASKTYQTEITLRLPAEDAGSWKLSLGFSGTLSITGITWKPSDRGSSTAAAAMNRRQTLTEALLPLVQSVDLAALYLEQSGGCLTVRLLPYPGAYVWVKLPPVHSEIPLKAQDLSAIADILFLLEAQLAP